MMSLPSDRADRVEEFMRLFAQHQRRLYIYLLSLVANPADAEELLQETNLILWSKFGAFEPGSNFGAWAARVAYFEALKYRERRGDLRPLGEEFLRHVATHSEQISELLELRSEALVHCLEKLPPRDRELITRRYAPGVDGQTLAKELRRPIRSVYKSITRIRKQLLDCINRRVTTEERP